MLKLPNVTLVAMGSTDIEGMIESLKYSASKVEFGKVLLVTDADVEFKSEHFKDIEVKWCPPMKSIDEWNKAIVYDLGDYIDTDYALLIHPDGGVGNEKAWDDKWLEYDYIGSPWPLPTDDFSYRDINGTLQRVGNSVSLRSKKLMQLPKKLGMEWKPFHGFTNEDGFIAVNMRHEFVVNGCIFAPFEEAVKFGCETLLLEHFGKSHPFVYHRTTNAINKQYPNFESND
jgi:hypothetical protein